MITYLVTGGAGFIGANFIEFLFKRYKDDVRVVNFDKLTYAGNPENLNAVEHLPNYRFVRGDVCDAEGLKRLFSEEDIDFVVHFAAESHVDRSITDPGIFARTNVLGTQTLLDAAKSAWQNGRGFAEGKKYLQVSTDEVYGTLGSDGYFTEGSPVAPRSPYSASKAGADLLVRAYFETYGMPVNITRCSNNYGPYQFPEKLIPLLINNALLHKPLPIYGDGLNVRDWLYVADHCAAIDRVLACGRPGEVYNIGGHNECTNLYIVKLILSYLGEHVDPSINEELITYVTDRPGHDRRYAIDPAKIAGELGWQPETSFEEGIKKTIEWYLNNRGWMERVTSGAYQHYYEKMYDNR